MASFVAGLLIFFCVSFVACLMTIGFTAFTMAKNETRTLPQNETRSPSVLHRTTADGLNVTNVLLAENLVPSRVEAANLVPKTAKWLFKWASTQRRDSPEEMTPVLGSTETIYSLGDAGFFSAVLTAYNNHWKLRTSPDDWWFSVIRRVACAIDKNAKKESVRKMFVDHEGKKTIQVQVPDTSIYTVDYSWFFDEIAKGIQTNVKVPEFVNGMTTDFSTTTAVQKIVSQITLMYSVQEYFNFKMMLACGIPALEMLGTEDDWRKLKSKLKVMRTLLEPIQNDIGLELAWWDLVEDVFGKLLDTYQGRPDKKWWSHIINYKRSFGSGRQESYRGWITEFLEGKKDLLDINDMSSGVVSVPLIIEDPYTKDNATLVAGMLGFTLNTDDTEGISVRPFQGWTLLLRKDSPFAK